MIRNFQFIQSMVDKVPENYSEILKHFSTFNCTHFSCWQSLFWIILHKSINKSNLFLCCKARKNLFPFFSLAIWKPVVVFPAFDVWSCRFMVENEWEKQKKNEERPIIKSYLCWGTARLPPDIPLLSSTHKQSKGTSFNYLSFPVYSFTLVSSAFTDSVWVFRTLFYYNRVNSLLPANQSCSVCRVSL